MVWDPMDMDPMNLDLTYLDPMDLDPMNLDPMDLAKKIEIGFRDVEIRVRSVRFTPKGSDNNSKKKNPIFGYEGAGCSQDVPRVI